MGTKKSYKLPKTLFAKIDDPSESDWLNADRNLEEIVGVGEGVVEVGEYQLVRAFKAASKIVVEEM